jgi:hypothetical protein
MTINFRKRRFASPTALTPDTMVLGVPVSVWHKAFTGNFERSMADLKLRRRDIRRRAVNQIIASWSIEGFSPDTNFLALLERYIDGEITLAEIGTYTDKEFGLDFLKASQDYNGH